MNAQEVTGYAHPAYAASLSEFGRPLHLERSSGWILERTTPGGFRDAMGCYPIFSCRDWTGLGADLDDLRGDLVSVVLVTDPFGDYDDALLNRTFHDLVRPYKEHFVTDLLESPKAFVSRHHQRNVQKAMSRQSIELCDPPAAALDDWVRLYGQLVSRHEIRSIAAFSQTSFEKQLDVPGMVAFRASAGQEPLAMSLWLVSGDVAYFHLGASSVAGYDSQAAFGLFWRAIEHFAATGLRWLDLGAAAGASPSNGDGLARFKGGWATGTRTAYLCGSILDPARYSALSGVPRADGGAYFPSYRAGEFA